MVFNVYNEKMNTSPIFHIYLLARAVQTLLEIFTDTIIFDGAVLLE